MRNYRPFGVMYFVGAGDCLCILCAVERKLFEKLLNQERSVFGKYFYLTFG